MGLAFPKPRPRILEKREKKAALDALDRQQRKLCKLRSGGRCEVVTQTPRPESSAMMVTRCKRSAVHNHHLLGGVGRRNRGESIYAIHRLDTCRECHQEIEAELLQPVDRDLQHLAAKVRYERVNR